MNAQGLPFDFSNWGEVYQTQGILAPGENILGAEPGDHTSLRSGTSFATPVVSGIVALLLSIQLLRGEKPNPHAVRDAILKSALPCNQEEVSDCRRFLGGRLNIPGAHALIPEGGIKKVSGENPEVTTIQPSEAKNIGEEITDQTKEIEPLPPSEVVNLSSLEESTNLLPAVGVFAASATTSESAAKTIQNSENPMTVTSSNLVASSSVTPSNVIPSGNCGCDAGGVTSSVTPSNASASLIYALGVIGYDFGTEARRDSFKQLMPLVNRPDAPPIPANPYDAVQMKEYLRDSLSEAKSLIWTLNLELTPIYAIEPQGPFASTVYECLREFLEGQVQAEDSVDFVERVSIPGVLTGRTVRLFSGQVVPVVEPVNVRGMYSWKITRLIDAAVEAVRAFNGRNELGELNDAQEEEIRYSLTNFLQRIYFDLRNLGQTSQERALNYAATDVFQNVSVLVDVLRNKKRPSADNSSDLAVTMQLDTLEVERSPFCRMDSDCWDVKIKFFDPENDKRAKRVIRYTIDVSDIMPVTLGKPRIWDVSN
jgi:cyanobactin maturation PatA/PatG family protease